MAPDRSSRKQCYIGRDAFFNCLDDNGILDAIKDEADAKKKCGKELQEFETACSQTWVSARCLDRDSNGVDVLFWIPVPILPVFVRE